MKKYCIKSTLSQGTITVPDMIIQIIYVDDDGTRARVGLRFWANEVDYDNGELPLTLDACYVIQYNEYEAYMNDIDTEKDGSNHFTQARKWLMERTPNVNNNERDFRQGTILDK
jgi:hypothetical protein